MTCLKLIEIKIRNQKVIWLLKRSIWKWNKFGNLCWFPTIRSGFLMEQFHCEFESLMMSSWCNTQRLCLYCRYFSIIDFLLSPVPRLTLLLKWQLQVCSYKYCRSHWLYMKMEHMRTPQKLNILIGLLICPFLIARCRIDRNSYLSMLYSWACKYLDVDVIFIIFLLMFITKFDFSISNIGVTEV